MNVGNGLITAGLLLLAIGVALKYAPWLVQWFGRLPGDIRLHTGQGMVFIPITSMVVVSVLLSVLLNLLRK